jgi:hypothetical protein
MFKWGALLGAAVCALVLATPALAAPTLPSQDPFYAYSGSLTGVAPGTVLKTRQVSLSESGTAPLPFRATQVLYRTTSQLGDPMLTVATIVQPLLGGVAPTKLVSYQTAYDALGPKCDPSYTLQGGNSSYSTAVAEEQVILSYVAAGYTVVVPDYEGVNLAWGAGQQSGYGTLDGIRAAEDLLMLSPSATPVGMVGYSGGSIATDFASELAPTYAPTLDVVGVAEGGIPVDFAHNLAYINGSQDWSGVIPAVLVGIGRAFKIDVSQYESAYGQQVAQQVQDECINSFLGSYPGLTIQKLVKSQYQDFFGVPLFASINNKLIMSRTGTPKGPLFMGVGNKDGTGDSVMIAADVKALAHTYCDRGVSVQFNEYKGDDHTGAAVPFELGAFTFITARLSGQQVPDGCSSIGAGNSLAPLPVAQSAQPKLKVRYIGPRRRAHGVVIMLRASTGTMRGLVVRLRHGKRVVGRVRLAVVTTHAKKVVLRVHGHMPHTGHYTLTITQGQATLLTRALTVR